MTQRSWTIISPPDSDAGVGLCDCSPMEIEKVMGGYWFDMEAGGDAHALNQKPATILETPNISVSTVINENRTIMITFSPIVDIQELPSRFAESFLAKQGISAAFVVANCNQWYQHPEMEDAIYALQRITRAYDRILLFGSSMGAFAALQFSWRLGADAVLAMAPQHSCSDQSFDQRWANWWQSIDKRLYDDLSSGLSRTADVALFYDNDSVDKLHAERIESVRSCRHFPLRESGHNMCNHLQQRGLLSTVVNDFILGTL